jgi:signal transduction histidine kinase/CheY-like chemotaxis protein
LVGVFTLLALAVRCFCLNGEASVSLWPADGALVVALIVLPKRLSLLVLAASFVINVIVNLLCRFDLSANIITAVLNDVLSLLLAFLMRNFCGAATDLSRFRRLATFVGLAVAASASEAAIGLVLASMSMKEAFSVFRWFWWTLGDSLGLVIGTPAVLFWVKNKRYVKISGASLMERMFLFLLIVCVSVIAFLQSQSNTYIFIYPIIIMMAFRAGPTWVLTSVLLVSVIAASLTVHGYGPLFAIAKHNSPLLQSVLQQFLISLFVCAVPVNNALGDMGRSAQRLRRVHATARAAQRAAVVANLAKSQFIANVSHEIRTPLNGVLGMAQILAADDLSDVQRQRVDIIHSSGEVLLSILNDVLDFSKIEAGKLDLEVTPFNLVKVVADVQAAFSAVAETKKLQLSLRVDGRADHQPIDDLYLGDPTRVRQIISNLVSNALKFTHTGGVEILVSCLDAGVVISVRDTGIGIPEDKLPKLFGQFEQVDASTTRRFGGTGLGLSICRELCSLMGGRIVVESQFGTGSTFTVHLPLKRRRALEGLASLGPTCAFEGGGVTDSGLRVLAAEDNATNQLVLTTLLQQLGVTPVVVENGAQAVEAWRTGEFDLILMDMQMPVMDGLTAVRAIRAAEAATDRPRAPIIALTADVMSHHLEDYRHTGIDAVVSKPIQFAELALAMGSLLAPDIDAEEPARMRA